MRSGIGPKQVAIVFLVVLVLYLGLFYGTEWLRYRQGPWELEFQRAPEGHPVVVVRQPRLRIEAVALRFPGEAVPTNGLPARVVFDQPGRITPFGRVIYEDLTSLPGVVTLNLFGHGIEIFPRALLLNRREMPWSAQAVIDLDPAAKPAVPPLPPKGGTRDK